MAYLISPPCNNYKMKKIFFFVLIILLPGLSKAQTFNIAYHNQNIGPANAVVNSLNGFIIAGTRSDALRASAFKVDKVTGDSLWMGNYEIGKGTGNLGNAITKIKNNRYVIGGTCGDGVSLTSAAFLIWLNENGDTIRSRKYGKDTNSERCYGVKGLANGNIIFAGLRYKKGKTQFSVGDADVYLVATDSIGNQLWEKQYGGTADEVIQSMDIATDGGYVLAGNTSTSTTVSKTYLVKTDNLGNLKWQKTYDDGFGSGVAGMITTQDGGHFLLGIKN